MPNLFPITDFADPALDVYARLTENQLVNREDLSQGLFIAESPKVIERALNAGYVPVSFLMEPRHVETQARDILARCGEVPVYTAPLDVLKQLTGFPLTRGMLCAAIMNWGGLSVQAQTCAMLAGSALSARRCVIGKAVQALAGVPLALLAAGRLF